MRRLPVLLGTLLLAGCGGAGGPSAPAPDAGVLLRLAPPVGQVSLYRMVSETSMEMEGMPMMDSGMEFTQTMVVSHEVVAAEGDRRTIAYTIDSVSVDAPGMLASLGQTLGQIEGLSARMVVSTRGDFESSDVDEETIPAGMQAAFEGMSESIKGLSLGFPAERVVPGDTWTVPMVNAIPMAGMGQMNQEGEMLFTLDRTESREDGLHALLSFSGTQTQTMTSEPSAQVSMGMDTTGETSGSVDVNLGEGRVTAMNMTITMSGVMSMMGTDIPLQSTVTMVQTLVGG